MPAPERLEGLIKDRMDAPLIRMQWETLEDKLGRLKKASQAENVHTIWVMGRSVWMSIHSLAQSVQSVFDEDLCQKLQSELESAREAASKAPSANLPEGIAQKSIAGLQKLADSLKILAGSESIHEFHQAALGR